MNVGGILVTLLVLAILIGSVVLNLRRSRHLSAAGQRLAVVVSILLIIEAWAAAYLWQRPGRPGAAAVILTVTLVATLIIGFGIALRIDLRQRRDQADAQR